MDKMDGRKGILVVHSSKKIEFRKMVKKEPKCVKNVLSTYIKNSFKFAMPREVVAEKKMSGW